MLYLSDLLSALNKNESIELSKSEIAGIFQRQKHVTEFQRIALFHKLGLRNRGENQEQIARKAGVSLSYIKQYDGAMGYLSSADDSLRSSILDALCAGELYDGEKSLEISRLYNKLRKGHRLRYIEHKGGRWYIHWQGVNSN